MLTRGKEARDKGKETIFRHMGVHSFLSKGGEKQIL